MAINVNVIRHSTLVEAKVKVNCRCQRQPDPHFLNSSCRFGTTVCCFVQDITEVITVCHKDNPEKYRNCSFVCSLRLPKICSKIGKYILLNN